MPERRRSRSKKEERREEQEPNAAACGWGETENAIDVAAPQAV
jgi:hypothetical protein